MAVLNQLDFCSAAAELKASNAPVLEEERLHPSELKSSCFGLKLRVGPVQEV